ncbi:hypothetical protein VCRA2123O444_280058 [Vibrio crassostreae]|nr:hypothetical protein VCRA2117O428_260018 [Vibrio crassostreae]CAK1952156.1 hypothetical protein VCRA2114O422_280058 [Vibrio crassostreae]CAK1958523.1 hypothetical protein VCRA2119O431_280058 [Vibrio crassostreae]CAK2817087.1 hypothetical protein VCRA2133O453_270017 [Vibrio crassostreae]CAK2823546.1 hypothetical protein VCRA2128O451_280058 [Vibrio crassostreae]
MIAVTESLALVLMWSISTVCSRGEIDKGHLLNNAFACVAVDIAASLLMGV